MNINKKLNLVVPMEDEEGGIYYVHAKPFSREAFEHNYFLFSQAFSTMIESGIQVTAGPRIAALVLKDIADKQGSPDSYAAIMAEIRRTSTVIKADPKDGYVPMLLSTAIARGAIGDEDLAYIEGAIAFFTLSSALWRGRKLDASLGLMSGLWDVQTTSLNSTDFTASLLTSIEGENSGEMTPE